MNSFTKLVILSVHLVFTFAQNFPVLLGRSASAVSPRYRAQTMPPPFRAQTPFPVPSSVPAVPGGQGLTQQGAAQTKTEPWAPGEPEWFFPSTSMQWLSSCQRQGCSEVGTHCVFWGSLCPSSVRRVPCQCQRGCRVDTHFIPFGQSKVMDRCNNICSCNSREGIARCTTRRC